jgi:TMEM175 potassium channel family protein
MSRLAFAAPRVGVAIALLCVAFFLLPQPKPRYRSGEEPTEAEKLNE